MLAYYRHKMSGVFFRGVEFSKLRKGRGVPRQQIGIFIPRRNSIAGTTGKVFAQVGDIAPAVIDCHSYMIAESEGCNIRHTQTRLLSGPSGAVASKLYTFDSINRTVVLKR